MELLQLKYFQAAAKTENFSQAAAELNISQPSLSITISRLEDELNVHLFDRIGRNVVLNEAGNAFLRRVNQVFCELESAKNEVFDISQELTKRLLLSTTGAQLLSAVFGDYIKLHPEVTINQKCGLLEVIEKELVFGEIDFCITLPPIKGENIECKILKEDEIILLVPGDHRLAQRKSINLAEVADDHFIALPSTYNFRAVMDSVCKNAGFTPKVLFEVDDVLMQEMIEMGKGVTLLPLYLIDRPHAGRTNLRMLKIEEPDPQIQIGFSWLKNRYFSETAREFREFFIRHYKI